MKKQRDVAKESRGVPSRDRNEAGASASGGSNQNSPSNEPGLAGDPIGTRRFRFDLAVLIGVVLLVNIPFLAGHCMPAHDTRCTLGIFDYFYSNYLFAGELPRWMAYGVYGLDASVSHVTFMSGASYLAMFVGKILLVKDSLFLFAISVCLEQMLLLLGLYLLCRQIFQERLAVFCICLTAISTVMWDSQISLNFRLYYLLPLEFYFILRLRQEEKGFFGWLVGITAVLGPFGSAPYFYPLWALIITIFSLSLFWGRFRTLLCMIRPSFLNIVAAVIFVLIALTFAGSLAKALNGLSYLSRDRQAGNGDVSLGVFLTYGGNDLGDMWKSLLVPSANIVDFSGRMGMTDYVGIVTILCLPFALGSLRGPAARSFAILTAALFALSRGGLLASAAYYFPGMHMFRHIGYVTALMKLAGLILAGFGLDRLIQALRGQALAKYASGTGLFLALLVIVFYLDFYIGGRVWGNVFHAPPPQGKVDTNILPSAVYPCLRAALLAALAVAVWFSCRRVRTSMLKAPKYVIFFLLACVAGDCALFQFEMFSLLQPASARIPFPAVSPSSSPLRSDEIASVAFPKYQAWSKVPGVEYQIALSSALQWDPLMPHFRVDLFPSNVRDLMDVLGSADTNELVALCKPKFRLLTQAVHVGTDQEALALLGSQAGWENKVILNDAGTGGSPDLNLSPQMPGNTLSLDGFSANSIALTVSNASPGPAWLVYSDAYSPGWHASVNGNSTPVLKAYGAFKAIRLDSGENKVRLNYYNGLSSMCLEAFAVAAACATALALAVLFWLAVKEPFTG